MLPRQAEKKEDKNMIPSGPLNAEHNPDVIPKIDDKIKPTTPVISSKEDPVISEVTQVIETVCLKEEPQKEEEALKEEPEIQKENEEEAEKVHSDLDILKTSKKIVQKTDQKGQGENEEVEKDSGEVSESKIKVKIGGKLKNDVRFLNDFLIC
jgi:hypothetical protein